jgi:hypothetical protein
MFPARSCAGSCSPRRRNGKPGRERLDTLLVFPSTAQHGPLDRLPESRERPIAQQKAIRRNPMLRARMVGLLGNGGLARPGRLSWRRQLTGRSTRSRRTGGLLSRSTSASAACSHQPSAFTHAGRPTSDTLPTHKKSAPAAVERAPRGRRPRRSTGRVHGSSGARAPVSRRLATREAPGDAAQTARSLRPRLNWGPFA